MSDIKVKFGLRLRQLRERKGWPQDELARRAGLDSSYVGRIERAERNITLEVVEKLAQALDVPVTSLFEFDEVGETYIHHPLEEKLEAPASDILEAISRGFRSIMNVKGQLAELYLYRKLQKLERQRIIANLDWRDADDEPDFFLEYQGKKISIECKNVRNERYKSGIYKGWFKVETQKTRSGANPKTGEPTRAYSVDRFDILAVCLFNQTRKWQYLFCPSRDLRRHDQLPDRLATFQPVPPTPKENWTDDLRAALRAVAGPCRKSLRCS